MFEKVKAESIRKLRTKAQEALETGCAKIKQGIGDEFDRESMELEKMLSVLKDQYLHLEKEGTCGNLHWIYISWLRSSILTEDTYYRIDFYDETGRLSDAECAGRWQFDSVFRYYDSAVSDLRADFSRQSMVHEYELEGILYELADEFHGLALTLMPELFSEFFSQYGMMLFPADSMKIMAGEFFDHAELIYEWIPEQSKVKEKQLTTEERGGGL